MLNRADELLVLRQGSLIFARRAGSWFFLAPEAIVQQMGGPRNVELRQAVYASCLDASFAGTGACLGILNAEATARLREIAPEPADHLLTQRSAKARLLQRAILKVPGGRRGPGRTGGRHQGVGRRRDRRLPAQHRGRGGGAGGEAGGEPDEFSPDEMSPAGAPPSGPAVATSRKAGPLGSPAG